MPVVPAVTGCGGWARRSSASAPVTTSTSTPAGDQPLAGPAEARGAGDGGAGSCCCHLRGCHRHEDLSASSRRRVLGPCREGGGEERAVDQTARDERSHREGIGGCETAGRERQGHDRTEAQHSAVGVAAERDNRDEEGPGEVSEAVERREQGPRGSGPPEAHGEPDGEHGGRSHHERRDVLVPAARRSPGAATSRTASRRRTASRGRRDGVVRRRQGQDEDGSREGRCRQQEQRRKCGRGGRDQGDGGRPEAPGYAIGDGVPALRPPAGGRVPAHHGGQVTAQTAGEHGPAEPGGHEQRQRHRQGRPADRRGPGGERDGVDEAGESQQLADVGAAVEPLATRGPARCGAVMQAARRPAAPEPAGPVVASRTRPTTAPASAVRASAAPATYRGRAATPAGCQPPTTGAGRGAPGRTMARCRNRGRSAWWVRGWPQAPRTCAGRPLPPQPCAPPSRRPSATASRRPAGCATR